MGVFCAVSGCFSTAYKRDNEISFHRFPLGNAILLNLVSFVMNLSFHSILITVFTVAQCVPIKENAQVCSIHFCKEDFVAVEGYTPSKPKLKSNAVLSLLLFNDPTFSKRRKIATATVIPQLVAPILVGQLRI